MTELRGLYLANLDLEAAHAAGVAKKIRSQMAALEAALGPVQLAHPTGGRVLLDGRAILDLGEGLPARRRVSLYGYYERIGRDGAPWDYVYLRYGRTSAFVLRMLARLRRANPRLIVIIELPSFPYHTESVGLRDRVFTLTDLFFRRYLKDHTDRIVTFSRQDEILGVPTVQTDNGVDVDALEVLRQPPQNDGIRLLGLANLSFWHGYDRVIAGLAAYRDAGGGRPVAFEIVGTGRELERLKTDAARLQLGDLVRFHGPLFGADLDAVVAGCHIGISSIGMHRLDVDTSNLKSREFCARGVPFVIAYPDRDFPKTFPWAFHAPEDDSPLDIAALLDFHAGLAPDFQTAMRAYAENTLSWTAKMAPVVAEIRALAAQR